MTLLRNIIAILLGLVIGSSINMALIMLGPAVIPPPDGVDITNMESLVENMHLFQPQHFVFPFVAHAMGTFIGAVIAIKIGTSHHFILAAIIATAFLAGGVMNVVVLPAPVWFEVLDIVLAYGPMGWLAYRYFGPRIEVTS